MKYSYGIILKCNDKYLIVQNRDSEAFIYFFFANIRKWSKPQFRRLFDEFSFEEKQRLLYLPFHEVYMDLYVNHDSSKHHNKYLYANENYNYLHSNPDLISILKSSYSKHIPWIFPKGRIEKDENEVDCAVREFQEETCLTIDKNLVDPNRYIEYKQFKQFYNFELTTRLYIVEIDKILDIKYQWFHGLIRSFSVSNEIQYATWVHDYELKHYLLGTLYYNLRPILQS